MEKIWDDRYSEINWENLIPAPHTVSMAHAIGGETPQALLQAVNKKLVRRRCNLLVINQKVNNSAVPPVQVSGALFGPSIKCRGSQILADEELVQKRILENGAVPDVVGGANLEPTAVGTMTALN